MRIETAQLPDYADSDDKILTTENAVIVLDGASAFRPVPVPASLYAATLGEALQLRLRQEPAADLRAVLSESIRAAVDMLELTPGDSPSSTVAIVRRSGDQVDELVLGDSPIITAAGVFEDPRLDELELPERRAYRDRLASGAGYDEHHRTMLRELQDAQAERRNREGGYWIAEAAPAAAAHALVRSRNVRESPWAVLATDGAFNTMTHIEADDWPRMAGMSSADLFAELERCQAWEAHVDPDGTDLPRSKRHDDKSIAAVCWDA
ncbi:protein phosphatase 2C domain-containing protein [Saccharopolyspora sp. NFXS83]|uniref:protein phosphatase 2C domain-containing protein n=1 Tax=Saccharopolyspora sp. NFXS83 TaxID=2993560 RepID=UPI00224A63EB|nr:protein phosphatase 2C domain-containing protein [Saccharopolyspora sp. NFXS83]MCX2733504.1 protein phosphatase 2C domain-containing protein [Saccharopolyspora sp. NFXS83]